MEENKSYFSELKQEVKEYVKDAILLLKLKAVKQGTGIAGILVVTILLSFLLFFFFLFLGITTAFLLGDWLDSMVAAYAIVLALYIGIIVLIVVNRKAVISRFLRTAIGIAFPKDEAYDTAAANN